MKDEHLKIKIQNHEPLNDSDMWSSSDCFLPQQQKQREKNEPKYFYMFVNCIHNHSIQIFWVTYFYTARNSDSKVVQYTIQHHFHELHKHQPNFLYD